jgi:protein-tyrosine phosphatase
MGISRSSTMVIYYLMKRKNFKLKDAIDYVKRRRSFISPNKGFIKILEKIEID